MIKAILDTSVVINGKFLKILEEEPDEYEIIIPVAVIDELQAQASKGKDVGFKGLEELKKIRKAASSKGLGLRFVGERPSLEDIKLAKSGRIDALIRDVARAEGGTLYTSDYVQALVAEAEGIPVKYIPPYESKERLSFEEYFTPETIILQFRAGAPPIAKRIHDDRSELVRLGDPMKEEEINRLIDEIIGECRLSEECGISFLGAGAMNLQLRGYDIAVAKPPFSDRPELMIRRISIKPQLELEPLYRLVAERIGREAKGIMIVGLPEHGVEKLADTVAKLLMEQGKIVKIIDLGGGVKGGEISTYGSLEGDFGKTAEFLIRMRPDYIVLNDMTASKDFRLFMDLRLMGIGVVGISRIEDPTIVLKRFLKRMDPDLLSKILNLLIHMGRDRRVKIYELCLVIRTPTGMDPAENVQPIVEVRDLGRDEVVYETYLLNGVRMTVGIEEVKRRLEKIRKDLGELLERLKEGDPKASIESISLNRVIIAVTKDVDSRLLDLGRTLMDKLGLRIEFELKRG